MDERQMNITTCAYLKLAIEQGVSEEDRVAWTKRAISDHFRIMSDWKKSMENKNATK